MRYLHIISSMDPRTGGPCQGIRNLTSHSHVAGHTVEVVCLDEPDAPYLSHESITVHALGRGRGAWCYHPALRPWLEQNLSRFDAVILNGLWQYPGYAMARLANRSGTPPYFVFPHGMLDPWFQHAPERRLKAIRNWFYWKLVEQFVIRRAEAILFTCAEELRLARDTFWPYQPKQQINVGYGVNQPPEYQPGMRDAFAEKCPGLNDRPYFLFLGRIHPKKGVGLMIKTYADVFSKTKLSGQKSEPTSNLQPVPPALVIAGPGLDTPYGKQMQNLAAEVGGQKSEVSGQTETNIFFPGMLTGDAKWGALYHTEAFVLTSHQENFGIAVAEALACGKPVLISNQINIWKEIEEDKAGLVAADTLAGAEQLFRRWKTLSLEEKAEMKRAATASYLNRFGVTNAAENLLTQMEELLAQKEV